MSTNLFTNVITNVHKCESVVVCQNCCSLPCQSMNWKCGEKYAGNDLNEKPFQSRRSNRMRVCLSQNFIFGRSTSSMLLNICHCVLTCHVSMVFYIVILCQGLHFGYSMNWVHCPAEQLQQSGQSCRWWRFSVDPDGQSLGRDGRGCPKNPPSFSPLHHPPSKPPYQLKK